MPWNGRGWTRYTSHAGLKNSFSTYRTSLIAPKPASNPDAGRVSPYSRLRCLARAWSARELPHQVRRQSYYQARGAHQVGAARFSRGARGVWSTRRGPAVIGPAQHEGTAESLPGAVLASGAGEGVVRALELLHGMELQDAGLVVHDDGLLDGLGGDLGMGLFCQIVDRGDGGDKGRPVSRPLKGRGTVVCF